MKKQDYTKIEEEWGTLLNDFSWGIFYDGDPKRYNGTQELKLWQFITKHFQKEYERGYKQAEMDEVFRDELL